MEVERKHHLLPVASLCERWARETRTGAVLGYPSISILHRMQKQGAGASSRGAPPELSEDVALLDSILAAPQTPLVHSLVIREWYCHYGAIQGKAERCGVGRTQLYKMHDQALEYLLGRLHAAGVVI